MPSQLTRCKFLLFAVLITVLQPAFPQGYSHDGNRWYEIEVSIFTNRNISTLDKEQNLQEKINLLYPEKILQLTPATASYAFDFPQANAQLDAPPTGPEYSPVETPFRILDFTTDPFITLGTESQEFSRSNQRINNSSEHRILYHAVWRQPVLNKVQSSAIFIRGGEQYGEHNELEGSITLSYNVNRVDIDTMLWLNSFMVNLNIGEKSLSPPPQIFPQTENNSGFSIVANDFYIEDISFMNETRQMRSYELHYLDHPAFGLLIQIRPYDLPLNSDYDL